jgi:hypothetical protein
MLALCLFCFITTKEDLLQGYPPTLGWKSSVSDEVNKQVKRRKCVEPGYFSSSTTHNGVSCGLRDEVTVVKQISRTCGNQSECQG